MALNSDSFDERLSIFYVAAGINATLLRIPNEN